MKNILLALLAIVVVVSAFFHQRIFELYQFWQLEQKHPDILSGGTVTWETLSFTSTARSGSTNEPLRMGELVIPVPFDAVYTVEDTYAEANGNNKSVAVMAPAAFDFFVLYEEEFTDADQATICTLLRKTSETDACVSNLALYDAYLKLHKDMVHFYTPLNELEMFYKLMILKSNDLPSNRVSQFETQHLNGYLYRLGTGTFVAHAFIDETTMYQLYFTNLSEAEVTTALSNITTQ